MEGARLAFHHAAPCISEDFYLQAKFQPRHGAGSFVVAFAITAGNRGLVVGCWLF